MLSVFKFVILLLLIGQLLILSQQDHNKNKCQFQNVETDFDPKCFATRAKKGKVQREDVEGNSPRLRGCTILLFDRKQRNYNTTSVVIAFNPVEIRISYLWNTKRNTRSSLFTVFRLTINSDLRHLPRNRHAIFKNSLRSQSALLGVS
jgi:hypothetical protein